MRGNTQRHRRAPHHLAIRRFPVQRGMQVMSRDKAFREIVNPLKIAEAMRNREVATGEMVFQRPTGYRAVPVAGFALRPRHRRQIGRGQRAVALHLLQDGVEHARIMHDVIEPLSVLLDEGRAAVVAEAAATKVDFFTLVRGED